MDDALKQKIEQIKTGTGLPVFQVKIGSIQYIYRGINRKEFRDMQQHMAKIAEDIRAKYNADDAKLNSELALLKEKSEEKLAFKCLLSPALDSELSLDALPAGAVAKISELCLKASGFDDAEPEQPQQL